jgi:outer membrane biosynthesis protein TonB
VTFSSNDDEDALIEKMMADVACMQKAAAADAAEVDDDETEDELESPMQIFTGKLMRCEEMSPAAAAAAAAANTPESLSPIVQSSSSHSFGQFVEALEVEAPEVEVEAPKTVVKAAKAPKTVKAPKEPKTVKAPKEPKTAVKAPKEPKAPKAVNAKEVEVAVAVAEVAVVEVAALATENKETNGKIYLLDRVPTDSFSFNGKTYLRTETDNVYDNLTHELIGVWDHANHEIIAAFDDDELYYSDVE